VFYLSEVVLVLEHALAGLTVRMASSFGMVLIASMLSGEAAVAVFAFPIVIRVAIPLIAMSNAGVYMLPVTVLGEPAIAL
jgi:hypothetical protein